MTMRILANENLPREAVEALRDRGHDVAWVRTDSPGSSDDAVIKRSAAQARVLITFDKDFGELAFRWGLSSPFGRNPISDLPRFALACCTSIGRRSRKADELGG